MKTKKNIISKVIGIFAVLSIFLVGCGQGKSNQSEKNTLNLSTASELTILDNAKADEGTSLTQLNHTGEGLYRLGKNSKVENALATNTKVSNDGLTYTFKIRNNDKWQDGTPVTANDFVYGWQRVVNPKTASQYAYLMDGIQNYQEIQNGKMGPDKLGVTAPNKDTLVVHLSKPVPYFKLLVAFPVFFPEQKSAIEKYGKAYGTTSAKTAYNGPFKPAGWDGTSNSWQLIKNNNYWNKKDVHLAKINFQVVKDPNTGLNLYSQKKLDMTTLSGEQVPSYKNKKGFTKMQGGSMIYLEMNQKHNKVLQNVKARQALSMIIDRNKLSNKVLRDGSSAPKGFISTNFYRNKQTGRDFAQDAYVKSGVEYNPTKAKQLWKEALKESGKKSVNLTLLADDTEQAKRTNEYLQNQIEQLPGATITNNNIPKKSRMSRAQNGQFDLVVSNWGADFADPTNFLSLMTKDNSYNSGKWSNDQYDKLVNDANSTDANNPNKRYQDMVNAEKVIMQDQGVVPLYQPATVQMWRPNVHGYIWLPAGMSNNYINIYKK